MSGFDNSGGSPAGVGTSVSPAELQNTAVTAGSYTYTALTVDADGRLTAAANGTAPYVPGGTDVAVADGGTGASTIAAAQTNLGLLSSRVTTQSDKTNATLANVTGLSLTVTAGATYTFMARLFCDFGPGGGKISIAGTATATAIIWEPLIYLSDATWAGGPFNRNTALGASVDVVLGAETPSIWIEGTITVNAGGTLTVQFAQQSSNVTPSSVLVGSTLTAQQL